MATKRPAVECSGWCYTEAEEDIVYDYAWTIERFSRAASNYKPGKTMYSDQFMVTVNDKQTRWRLKMYPNGRKEVDKGYVTLFLKDSGREQPANLRASVKFSVVDVGGNKTNTKTIDKEYKVLNHAFGYSKFIKHQALQIPERGLLPDDKLTLLCSISIQGRSLVNSGVNSLSGGNINKDELVRGGGSSKLGTDMSQLLTNPQQMFADMRLVCGQEKEEILCHTNILAARSPVFQAMFQHDMKEARTMRVTVPDLEPNVVRYMLHYIYTGVVKCEGRYEDLLAAADKYSLLELKSTCEENLCMDTKVESVLSRLVLADRHNAARLKSVCVELLVGNRHVVIKQVGWKETLQAYPHLLAEMFEVLASSPPCKRRRVE